MASNSRKRMKAGDIIECLDDSGSDISFDGSDLESEYSSIDNESDRDLVSASEDEQSESEDDVNIGGAGDAGIDSDGWMKWNVNDDDFARIPFTARNPGFQVPNPRPVSELDYFQLFFTDALLLEITTETNRFAAEKIQKQTPLRKRSMWVSWSDVTLVEMKAFLGVILNMAMHEKPDLQSYFSEDWASKQPFFKEVFSRNRFLQIFWAFHVCPPPQQPRPAGLQPGDKK